jgi:signal transduction histidine kinase
LEYWSAQAAPVGLIDRRRTLSQMVAGVAHEINTPLGIANHADGIIADLASDLARAPGRDDASRETLDDILAASRLMQESIARADHLVQTFKSLSVSQAVDKLESTHLLRIPSISIG